MQASQALQTVLGLARERYSQEIWAVEGERDPQKEAIDWCDKILNTAVPLARFRAMVTVEKVGPKSKLGVGDFTVCGITISAIKNGLIGLSMEPLDIYLQLWEHRNEDVGGMDMLTGYQGPTKTLAYREFLRDIDRFQRDPSTPTNAVQV